MLLSSHREPRIARDDLSFIGCFVAPGANDDSAADVVTTLLGGEVRDV